MPATTIPPVAHYEPAPETQEEIEYAAVPVVDFAKVHTPEGRAELAPQVRDATRTYGFMCVVNHGLSQAQNDRMTDIANVPFTEVPEDEQMQFVSKTKELGEWKGYKPRQYWHVDNGVRDQIHHYATVRPAFEQQHPKALQRFLPEIRAFMEHNQSNVLHPVLRLLALGLELPEEVFVERHQFEAEGLTFRAYLAGPPTCILNIRPSFPRTDDDEARTKNVWMKGHTDSGTISLLWSQPVVALQIMSPDGKWRYVKHVPNSIIVNAGDAMEMFSGGYYKATIHRVFQPPRDQQGYTRLGLFYFAYADADVRLVPSKESPVLQRVGITRKCEDEEAPTMSAWSSMRASMYGNSETKRKGNGIEEQVVNGMVIKHYN
ncbi:Clavaminate synthase-like protein [Ganoderma leucocontextum]|nr:Clavaminate synthase-like protein [Ganoderma leucocontextum]